MAKSKTSGYSKRDFQYYESKSTKRFNKSKDEWSGKYSRNTIRQYTSQEY